MLSAILSKLKNEPVLVRSIIAGAISLVALAGITVPDDTLDKAVDGLGLLISIALMFDARNRVTPV